MQTEPEIRTANNARVFFWLQPPRPELNPARRQSCEPAFELHTARTIAGDENHQIGEPASRRGRLPAANAILEPADRIDHHVEVLVFRPTRRAHDEPAHAKPHTETPKQSLAELLALHPIERDEDRRGPVIQDMHLTHPEAILDE